jgi:hypothetical protein
MGVKSGDLAGRVLSRYCLKGKPQCGGVPSCWNFLQDLRKRTVHSVEAITPQICRNDFRTFEHRTDIVRAAHGAQIEVQ